MKAPAAKGWGSIWPAAIIAIVVLAAYSRSLSAPFLFDDLFSIGDNPSIRNLGSIMKVMTPPDTGASVTGRPVINLSFALNYAVGGLDPWGYHVFNLTVHVLAALVLFGIMRRSLLRQAYGGHGTRQGQSAIVSMSENQARNLALVIALLWAVHPLQTESVTCIVQRTESLMGLFYLLTMYCFIRAVELDGAGPPSPPSGGLKPADPAGPPYPRFRANRTWLAASVGSCLLGMGTKEVMVSAPLMVLLYDRTFLAGTFGEAWRRRRGLYVGLAATWLWLAWLVIRTGANRGGTSGFGTAVTWWDYALTQFEAVTRYLALSIWPHPLVLDYGTYIARGWAALIPEAVLVLGLATAAGIAVWRRSAWGFAGAWFFAILAPSSSVVPLATQTIAEHRMYLPLAAVIAPLVLMAYHFAVKGSGRESLIPESERVVRPGDAGIHDLRPDPLARARWRPRPALPAAFAVVVLLAVLTDRRNLDYRSPAAIWEVTVEQRPDNQRARHNLGQALYSEGRLTEALPQLEQSVRLEPTAAGHVLLGLTLSGLGRGEEALSHLRTAAELDPGHFETRMELAAALLAAGNAAEGFENLRVASELLPDRVEAHTRMGQVLASVGSAPDALRYLQSAVALDGRYVDARVGLGNVLFQLGRFGEARDQYLVALQLDPGKVETHYNLALVLVELKQTPEAVRELENTLRIRSDFEPARGLLDELRTAPATKLK